MDNEQEQNEPISVSLSDKKRAVCSWVRDLDEVDLDALIKEFEIDVN